MDSPNLSLRLFGDFCLTVDGKPRQFITRKAEQLVAYLVLTRTNSARREKLLEDLWPDTEESKARGILSTTLWRAQKALLGLGVSIRGEKGWLYIDAPRLDVDALRFKSLAELPPANPEARLANLESAVSLYKGELLEGVDEEWCELERGHYRAIHITVLKELIGAYRARAEYGKAIEMARRVVALDSIDEEAHRELMLLFHLQGNRSAALAQYQTLHRILQSELGVTPEAGTTDLWRHIRSRSDGISQARPATYLPVWAELGRASQSPMVGRQEELSQILKGLADSLHAGGSVLLITGEAGIGKTKLIEEAEVEAKLRGFEVLRGRCTELSDLAPYQAFIEALWPRISRKIHTDTPQVLHDFLGRLSPALRRRRVSTRSGDAETAVINEMLLGLLDSNGPVLLILEDFQHADPATRNLIHLLASRLGNRKLVALLSLRIPVSKREPLAALLRIGTVSEIRLAPLTRGQTYELVGIQLRSRSIASSVLSAIWDATGGNPFAIVEYTRFLAERGQLVSIGDTWGWADSVTSIAMIPRRVQALLRERIETLSRDARTVLHAASVLGHEADLLLLEKLSGLESGKFAEIIAQLFECGLLVETSRGYRFAHESYRFAALDGIATTTKRMIHGAAAFLMEDMWPARTEDLAWHCKEAGDLVKAIRYAKLSGDKARAVHANGNALRWYSNALELLRESPESQHEEESRVGLLFNRQEVLELLGHSASQLADLDEIIRYGKARGKVELVAQCECLRARCLGRMNKNLEGLEAATAARQLYASLDNASGQARAHEVSALLFMNLRDARRAREAYEKAHNIFQSVSETQGIARAALGMGTLMLFTGENRDGLAWLERAEATLARSGDIRGHAHALLQKGVFCRCLGQARKSEALISQGIELMRQCGDRVGEARGLSQLAYTHMTLGLPRNALHEARRSIQLAIEAGDTRGQIVFRNNAAYAIYRCLGDFERAQRCVHEAIALVRTSGQRENLAIYYDTVAAILHDRGDYVAAYHWAQESRRLCERWSGRFDYVRTEVEFRLGTTALALGKIEESRKYLSQACARWQASHDRALLAHAISLLGLTALAEGNMEHAVDYANQSARLLRRSKEVEELQQTYWAQYKVYKAASMDELASRALRRAFTVVIERSSLLKGRLRRTFLAIPANERIVKEYGSFSSSMKLDGRVNRRKTSSGLRVREVQGVLERRGRLLSLIREGTLRRRKLAGLLGVSERTIRSDLAALRLQGLLPKEPHLAMST